LEAVLKSLLATPEICPKLILCLEAMFSEILSYRSLVKPCGRIKGHPLCPELKDFPLREVPI
jgi:hypothetical protein